MSPWRRHLSGSFPKEKGLGVRVEAASSRRARRRRRPYQSRTRTAQPERATRIDEMTDRERRAFEDQLAEDAQRRYERMADAERQRYIADRQREQRRLG